eukprot:SAG31_NODE_2872_length_4972_cov_55.151447_5_plen_79_part_00
MGRVQSVCTCTGVFREIETAVPDERIPVLYVLYILLAISYNIKVNIFGLNEVKIEIDSPGAGLCTCLVPNLYFIRYPK